MAQHSLTKAPQGTTTILWDARRRQWRVWSDDPQMIDLLKGICAQHGIVPVEEGSSLSFFAPAEVALGYEDFAPDTRSRIQFGFTVVGSDEGVIDGRQRELMTPVVIEMSSQGTLDTKRGDRA